ncbi:hypothetical protein P10VF_155 [Rhizobium phage vB_RleM_P10VF]|uniref:Uncharacterized protein n=1 Tax=Rhizobium phage vB_RleM_P10VF TaxID=1527770 RepID=A0A076YIU4_9CAUD|nr:hypothetical protein P10VF_155 [Rhizobium phage vB_RleM_P10VF]AIK68368.1 hypothetical protein P10VF_155 [Rhizobium phage vB_RleM_P10VF]
MPKIKDVHPHLINGTEMRQKYPTTFEMPSSNLRFNFPIGQYAKIGLQEDGLNGERFWVIVTRSEVVDGKIRYEGKVNNKLVIYKMRLGAKIAFGPEHILGHMA